MKAYTFSAINAFWIKIRQLVACQAFLNEQQSSHQAWGVMPNCKSHGSLFPCLSPSGVTLNCLQRTVFIQEGSFKRLENWIQVPCWLRRLYNGVLLLLNFISCPVAQSPIHSLAISYLHITPRCCANFWTKVTDASRWHFICWTSILLSSTLLLNVSNKEMQMFYLDFMFCRNSFEVHLNLKQDWKSNCSSLMGAHHAPEKIIEWMRNRETTPFFDIIYGCHFFSNNHSMYLH